MSDEPMMVASAQINPDFQEKFDRMRALAGNFDTELAEFVGEVEEEMKTLIQGIGDLTGFVEISDRLAMSAHEAIKLLMNAAGIENTEGDQTITPELNDALTQYVMLFRYRQAYEQKMEANSDELEQAASEK